MEVWGIMIRDGHVGSSVRHLFFVYKMAEPSNKCFETMKKVEKEPWVNVDENIEIEDTIRRCTEAWFFERDDLIEISSDEEKRKREEKGKKKKKNKKRWNFGNSEIEFRNGETEVFKVDLTESVFFVLIVNLMFMSYFFLYGIFSFMKIGYSDVDSKFEYNSDDMRVEYKVDLTNSVLVVLILNVFCFLYFFVNGLLSFVKKNCK